ncbi:hypothetical protein A2716_03415 [candidate division WWE3 bacterium RIFCSPHIGHO2_01_FULL_40_23]|uniref:UDP-N-acetylglucosamine--N-acetylmuramyl-(pentapeptide) pyrophosphoryl-undecaprenol N-acetylglucosamine transferase n=1 Tax=candidate division WWE3 bacterium RIFCSPLOWO2_01_FULL_41_18 TaxID=1802625 RepID=A0A1F4VD52_UNCKA|nr:MAG: hypothetical protein A2716_03415 [candidate division WWE3 bacterium RIFCSPHIGHO2_01_FULL_40_23]OGC54928.1 MAG: hypothetical protein A3A78_03025 [candidate division WWE3 bacterium RIFCSPLOWO2_01_FULL_41_18]
MKLLITGGHHTTAIPVINEFKKRYENVEILWVGHTYSLWKDKNKSSEYKEITSMGIPFFDIDAGKFYKIYSPFRIAKTFFGLAKAFRLLQKLKPDGILSFGGYISVPVVLAGFLLRIPSATHEQTVVAGFANRFISFFVKRIYISWRDSAKYFPKSKTLYTGLPIREEVLNPRSSEVTFNNNLPIIYITGGKQGSHVINECVKGVLEDLLIIANVIHQCGSYSESDDYNELLQRREKLPEGLKERYKVYDYIDTKHIGEVLSKTSLVVSRAGANTVYELLALEKPSIFIPIPWVSHNEQFLNAKIVEDLGLSKIIPEEELTKKRLIDDISFVLRNLNSFILKSDRKIEIVSDSAKVLADDIYQEILVK